MLLKTNGIVLRSIKYGDSSLVTTIFTTVSGVKTYLVQGVRSAKPGKNRGGTFQPGMLLELVVYEQPQKNLQRIREFQPAYLYTDLQENVVKNSIVLFSTELLLRLLPEQAPLPDLFDLAYTYFITLDKMKVAHVPNFPLYFIINCARLLGYDLKGDYSAETPNLNLQDGGFTTHPPAMAPYTLEDDAKKLDMLMNTTALEDTHIIEMNGATRIRLLEWYIAFLENHTQHMGNIRSLPILQAILH